MFERFTADARAVVVAAQAEARALRHGVIGTEHLLLGMLAERDGPAAALLAGWGLDADAVRAEVERRAGAGEPGIDADALAAIGIDLDEVRDRVERTFGPGALGRRRRARRRGLGATAGTLPFSAHARKALELALREALALGDRHIGAEHVLLGLVRSGGVAEAILRARGVDHGAVRAALGRDAA
jgi:ATP-dependent Clp protease ATP-binding subunit ClpA